MKYKKLIFDLDNTILDFEDTEEKALKKIINTYKLPYTTETIQSYKEITHDLWRKLEQGKITREKLFASRFFLFLEKFGIEVDGKKVDHLYRTALSEGFLMMEHAHEVLTVLKKSGYKLYAGTNGVAQTQRQRLKGAELNHFFENIFISEEIGVEKPDPQFFNYIFETLNSYNNEEYLMIGDSLTSDIKGAKNAGIDSVWYNFDRLEKNPKAVQSTYTITNLLELLPLFGLEKI
ncbi:YjjG family noncanonical pyrimidine nucleotidase [Alkalibacterium kapii]|nr:YjjG family noncanonical pyrimidine nucleotidase [Alkalibacterium kapii]